ncbi:hotdog fold thioesterase [Aromatoleum evansii]|nr:hotdog fold thioesterase [Aromatoleum evansii]
MTSISHTENAVVAAGPYDHAIGSGFARQLGCRVVRWEPDYVEVELDIAPQHLNRAGTVHGGVIATLIDVACALAGLHSSDPSTVRKAVTLSLNTSFTGQVSTGTLRAHGRVRSGGRSIFFASTEVTDGDSRQVAHGEAVNRYRRGSENPHGSPDEHINRMKT